MMIRTVLTLALILATGSIDSARAQTPRAYRVDDIGSLGGDWVWGAAINARGDIAGSATLPDGTLHAFRWTEAAGLEDLGAHGGVQSNGFGINDRAEVVGVYFDAAYQAHGFIARPGEPMQDLGPVYGEQLEVRSIIDDGRMSGAANRSLAFRTRTDGTIEILTNDFSSADAMNQFGDATGWRYQFDLTPARMTSFRYSTPTGFADLGSLGGDRSAGTSINAAGIVVGWSERQSGDQTPRAFRSQPGLPMEDLGTLPGGFAGGYSSAGGINDAGEIVGWSDAPYGWTAFVYSDAEGMLELQPRIPIAARSAGTIYSAFGINQSGQIGAMYEASSGLRIWRLTRVSDVPAPAVFYAAVEPGNVLVPPDGRMVSLWANVAATDAYDVAPACRIASVNNSEAPSVGADPDVQLTGGLGVNLRATRNGSGPGRTYTLNVECSNYFGKTTATQLVVRVPHDQRTP